MNPETSLERLRPLLRTILPALLYSAGLEMLLSRVVSPRDGLFSIPGRQANPVLQALLDQVSVTLYHFALWMAVIVVILLGLNTLATRTRGIAASWVGPGLLLLGIWSLARFLVDTPALDLAYQFLSLGVALGILYGLFGNGEDRPTRAFAVLASAALACGAYVAISQILRETGGVPLRLHQAARMSGELLALGCGALVPALLPWSEQEQRHPNRFHQGILAALPAGLFLLLFSRRQVGFPEPRRWNHGWSWDLPLPQELAGLLYAGVLFLFFFAVFRALWEPRWRLRGYGLAFLFLAGLQHRIAYQHLLALMGLILLVSGGEPATQAPRRSRPAQHA